VVVRPVQRLLALLAEHILGQQHDTIGLESGVVVKLEIDLPDADAAGDVVVVEVIFEQVSEAGERLAVSEEWTGHLGNHSVDQFDAAAVPLLRELGPVEVVAGPTGAAGPEVHLAFGLDHHRTDPI
jgi:hypothetical protein